MTGQQLRNSILQEAIQGRLVPNVLEPGEKTGAELLQEILAKRQRNENEQNGKKARKLTLSTIEEEPYELPNGWCWCRVGDIADIERGGNFKKSDFVEKGYPCIHYGQIHMRFGPRTYSVLSYLSSALAYRQRKAHTGDIVMAVTSENIEDVCKCTAWLGDYDVAIGAHTAIIRHYLNPVYLVYFFKSSLFYSQKKELGHGSKVVEVTPITLNNVILPLPPLSIQKAIVDRIEELFPLINEYDRTAGELEALNRILPEKLRKSALQEAIHGTLVTNDIPEGEATASELLQQILKERQERENKDKGKKAKKLTLSTIKEEPWELPKGWCWCRGKDIFFPMESTKPTSDFVYIDTDAVNNRKNIIDNPKNVRLEDAPSRATRKLHSNDILFSMVRPYLKNIAYVEERFSSAIGTTGFYVITTSNKLYQPYIFKMLLSDYVVSGLTEFMKGDNSPSINNSHIEEFLYPIPPLSIQRRIVEKIEEVFSAIDKLTDSKES